MVLDELQNARLNINPVMLASPKARLLGVVSMAKTGRFQYRVTWHNVSNPRYWMLTKYTGLCLCNVVTFF